MKKIVLHVFSLWQCLPVLLSGFAYSGHMEYFEKYVCLYDCNEN